MTAIEEQIAATESEQGIILTG
ncbi:MAG: hypothetical protein QOG61_40, partial [Candidatus Binataceae bacterium]|nr:hypothetical protein [Candidatus Binataceae bacterium]